MESESGRDISSEARNPLSSGTSPFLPSVRTWWWLNVRADQRLPWPLPRAKLCDGGEADFDPETRNDERTQTPPDPLLVIRRTRGFPAVHACTILITVVLLMAAHDTGYRTFCERDSILTSYTSLSSQTCPLDSLDLKGALRCCDSKAIRTT